MKGRMEQYVEIFNKKAGIFEESQREYVTYYSEREKLFSFINGPASFYEQAEKIICGNRRNHEKYIPRFAPCIKQQRRGAEQYVAVRPARYCIIQDAQYREKGENKNHAAE